MCIRDSTSVTAQLAAAPSFSIPIASTLTFFGMDQMAMHPSGTKLYVSQPGALNVYDASNGTLLTSITGPSIVQPTGVCVVAQQAGCGGFPCGNNDNKVLLCHVPPGNPANAHTLCISPKAVAAHLESHPGDHCAPCGDGGPLFQADVVQPCPDDVNGDGTVNTLDLIDVLLCLGQPGIPGCEAKDVSGDGSVNGLDRIDLLRAVGVVGRVGRRRRVAGRVTMRHRDGAGRARVGMITTAARASVNFATTRIGFTSLSRGRPSGRLRSPGRCR